MSEDQVGKPPSGPTLTTAKQPNSGIDVIVDGLRVEPKPINSSPGGSLQRAFWSKQRAREETPVLFTYDLFKGDKPLDEDGLGGLLSFGSYFLQAAELRALPPGRKSDMTLWPKGFSAELYVRAQAGTHSRFFALYTARGFYEKFVDVREVVKPRYFIANECVTTPIFGTDYGQTRLGRDCNGDFKEFAEFIGDVHRAWLKDD